MSSEKNVSESSVASDGYADRQSFEQFAAADRHQRYAEAMASPIVLPFKVVSEQELRDRDTELRRRFALECDGNATVSGEIAKN